MLVIYELKPTPWAFMLGNTFGWITYGILVQDLFVFFGNAPGFLMAFWLNLQAAKMQYETFRSTAFRKSIVNVLTAADQASVQLPAEETTHSDTVRIVRGVTVTAQTMVAPAPHETLVMANVVVWLAIAALISFSSALSDETKEFIVGIVVNLNLVVFYGAPLSTIMTVLTTQSSSSIHVATMITNTCNGTFWAAYGIAIQDWFIIVPNSLGAGLGVVQIALCLLFARKATPSIRGAAEATANASPSAEGNVKPAETEQHDNEENTYQR